MWRSHRPYLVRFYYTLDKALAVDYTYNTYVQLRHSVFSPHVNVEHKTLMASQQRFTLGKHVDVVLERKHVV